MKKSSKVPKVHPDTLRLNLVLDQIKAHGWGPLAEITSRKKIDKLEREIKQFYAASEEHRANWAK